MTRTLITTALLLISCSQSPAYIVTDSGPDAQEGDDDDDSDFDTDIDSDTSTDIDADSDSDTDTDGDADTGTSGDGDTDMDTDTDSDTDSDTDGDSDTDSDTDVDTDTDTDTDTDSDPCVPDCEAPDCWAYDCSPEYCDVTPIWGPCEQIIDPPIDCVLDPHTSTSASFAVYLPSVLEMLWGCGKCKRTIQWYGHVQPGHTCIRVRTQQGRVAMSERGSCDENLTCAIILERDDWWVYVIDNLDPSWMYVDVNTGEYCELECE